ncbi:uncharacterized protein LOC117567463 isoform X1 [Drosophila albomicans]|uniref:Uncharacterized protein LOC117567463 isoform X1 n=2 Tax=Drosophila albomicans TaxID=7291 RepID=A0A6P8WVB9_DROAB|nr:uncharacterized protein LOC117567463 isoform X1 [Drosophila albomicans]
MGKRKNRLKKKEIKRKLRQQNKKRIISPRKLSKPHTLATAANTCQSAGFTKPAATSTQVSGVICLAPNINNPIINTQKDSTMAPHQHQFKKFKDIAVIKPVKRLNNNKMKGDTSYSQKLVNSLKRRALNSKNNPQRNGIKRKLDFKNSTELSKRQLPKPKFYVTKKQARGSKAPLNKTIEEGEIIEEIESSDDDDCILISPVVDKVIIECDESAESQHVSNADIPSCSFVVDKTGDYQKPLPSNNGFMYPTNSMDASLIAIDDSLDSVSSEESEEEITDRETNLVKTEPNTSVNDSVIFVKETMATEDFIPLPADEKSSPRRGKKRKTNAVNATPKVIKRMNESLFTTTERKKLADYNSNTYNPGTTVSTADSKKRPIIIDGSNVAFAHGCSNVFSAEGVKYCIEYFLKMGHDVKAVIPQFRRNQHKSSNPALLDQLHKDNKIVFTPCKNLPNQQSISYDDRFILQLAYEKNAAIVSNDNYRDLIHENAAFKKIIENRVIGYSWCDDILILPKDPYGRFGPPLDEILRC